ncbi:MAG: PA14 domain-containing protein [Candidatus Promineifilaceae bacterium]
MKTAKRSLIILILLLSTLFASSVSADDATWTASYWNNTDFSGAPVLVRQESDIFYEWRRQSPAPNIVNANDFSARWERNLTFTAGTYEFKARADDQMRIFVDGRIVIDQWYAEREDHTYDRRTQTTSTGLVYMTAGAHDILVEYVEFGDQATAQVTWDRVLRPNDNVAPPAATQFVGPWTGAYYPNTNLRGAPSFVREDANIDFDWERGSPATDWKKDAFSIRWTNEVKFSPGRYRFTAIADDGVRVYVNNRLLINEWADSVIHGVNREITILDDSTSLKVEYREGLGEAEVRVFWVLVYPIGNSGNNNQGETGGAVPVVKEATMSERTAVRQTFRSSAPPLTFAEKDETVRLAGSRSADSQWIRIVTAKNIWGWVPADKLQTDYPLNTLDVWRSDW